MRRHLLAIPMTALAFAVAGGCAALLGANDPIEVSADGSSQNEGGSEGGVIIGDASRPEIGACPLCTAPPNATATCDGGRCGFACVGGYHLCDGGCTRDDNERACGATCADCAPGDGTLEGYAVCNAGRCGMVCDPGWVYCGQPGACVSLTFDCHNCGTCGHYCGYFGKCQDGGCVPANGGDLPCN